jgi:chaperonin GroEL (HSP60 family)
MPISDDMESEALTALVVNKLRGILNVCAGKVFEFEPDVRQYSKT